LRVLIADPYPFFRRGLAAFLEEQSDLAVVGICSDADELLRLCQELRPDVLLLALDLPGFDGVVPLGAILDCSPGSKCVVLAIPGDEEALAACVDSGCAAYVMKNADPSLILHAIRAVKAGGPWLQRELTGSLFQEPRRARGAERDRTRVHLSEREGEVLSLLAEGCRNAEIAKRLFISERTVKVHVSSIFAKLGLEDRVQATRYAIRTGLVRV
jgi:DNA-binding NarL/FixJ family response regulator